MDGLLKAGTIVSSESGNKYIVEKFLGAGGQGEVYDVVLGTKHYALKWYYRHTGTKTQRKILENLISMGKPSESFLWPEDIVHKSRGGAFGYIMELRPNNFKSIVDLMKRKADPSFHVLCKVAYNMTKGYQKLHEIGYSYRDISFGNLFFDPNTGDVLICDNDNVSINGYDDSTVYGTPRFMAPEIVRGQAKPSRNTDLFSLAVLLFYIFMLNHPLEGKLEADIRCMDIYAMNKLYGKNPVFIFDPDDKSNRPVEGYQDNALIYWDLYPERLKKLFTQAFTAGISSPNRRVTENKWLETFTNLMDVIIKCPYCGAEVFYDEYKEDNSIPHVCWSCNQTVGIPSRMIIGKNTILLTNDMKLKAHSVYQNGDFNREIGVVVQNPNNPNLFGIRNMDTVNWIYEKADGTQILVAPGRAAGIVPGAKLHFENNTGVFK